MPTIADYSVLRDGSFDLETGEEHELPPVLSALRSRSGNRESKSDPLLQGATSAAQTFSPCGVSVPSLSTQPRTGTVPIHRSVCASLVD